MMYLSILMPTSLQAQIEGLVMPGPVIEGHADLETDCSNCHVRFARGKQRRLCLDCHEDVDSDIAAMTGFHGLFTNAREDNCASCHTEHEGRGADVVRLDVANFDHDLTDFPLLGGHNEAECTQCHAEDLKYREAPHECFACHEDDNVHDDTMGELCDDCHNPSDWKDVTFDHDTTGFSLIGNHRDALCLDCHEDQTFKAAPTECYDCHAEDDAHNGRSGDQCGNCHKPTGWQDTLFDHDRDTDFPLIGKHSVLVCDDCHSDDPFSDEMNTGCVSCHLEDDNHDGHFGNACQTCHSPEDWPLVLFDHDIDTDHPLVGAHEALECNACHIEPIYEVSLVGSCHDCHAEDEPHDGTLGIRCSDCHNEETWDDKVFFDHDLTNFPLLGNHVDAECDACHDSHVFNEASVECVSCHRDDDPHRGNFHDGCDQCHNPIAWDLWMFDHNVETEFMLEGAHVDVACEDCHRSPLERIRKIDGTCRSCHIADDVHDGEFGSDCGRCHTPDNFSEVRSLQ